MNRFRASVPLTEHWEHFDFARERSQRMSERAVLRDDGVNTDVPLGYDSEEFKVE